jgi:hypothetical protein
MSVSVGLPTGMKGLTCPIPFSDPEMLDQMQLFAEEIMPKVK